MVELELTLLSSSPNPSPQVVQVLNEFEEKYRIRVNPRNIHWTQAQSELLNYALLKDPPDVSDLGSTWLGGFIAMTALRPFSLAEIQEMGEDAFLPFVWNSGKTSSGEMYAIPWIVDLRSIYYRKDHFKAAGLGEVTSFSNIEDLKSAWKKLQDHGFPIPWAFTANANTLTVLHYLASWIWQSGGKFISGNGKQPLFNSGLAKEGMYQYFMEQLPYLAPQVRTMDDILLSDTFRQGNSSMIFSGFWVFNAIMHNADDLPIRENLGIATLPMPSYVGGNNLVVWKDSRHSNEAVKLIQFLTSYATQLGLENNFAQLPARTDALSDSLQATYPEFQSVIMQNLHNGRTFSAPYLWGVVETRLLQVVIGLWQELFNNPKADIKQLINHQMDALAKRLKLTLSARG